MCQKTLASQASKALFKVKKNLIRFGDVKVNILLIIFDSKILPILLYGSEIWFSYISPDIEQVHTKFCKFILNLPIKSPNCFVKSELGRYSVTLYRNFKAVMYWLRIICMPNDKFPKLYYKLQR